VTSTLGVGNSRKRHDADSITDISVALFRERGYDATSMDQLASAAGISKAAFYHHVSGKERLLEAGMNRALDALEALFDEPRTQEGSSLDRVSHLLERIVQLEHSLLNEVTVLLRARGNSEVERTALQRRRAFDHRFGDLVARAQEEGDVRSDLDAHLSARLVVGMATWLVEWYRPDGPITSTTLANHVVCLAMQGLSATHVNLQT
jgi:AcrR family transcriptional regulator